MGCGRDGSGLGVYTYLTPLSTFAVFNRIVVGVVNPLLDIIIASQSRRAHYYCWVREIQYVFVKVFMGH